MLMTTYTELVFIRKFNFQPLLLKKSSKTSILS